MLIDWFTVGAQALNFLILVWLMKRFLYQPILRAIDAREQRIATQLAEADATRRDAEAAREEFRHKNEAIDQQREEMLRKAREEADAERKRLLEEARQGVESMTARRQEALHNDARNLDHSIARRAQQEVFAITRKTLSDLASVSLEERMAEVFIRRLRETDEDTRQRLAEALHGDPAPALVRSAFALPPAQQAAITHAIQERLSSQGGVRFEAAPELVGGIELTTGGLKLAWSIDEYLASLQRSVVDSLPPAPRPSTVPDAPLSGVADPDAHHA